MKLKKLRYSDDETGALDIYVSKRVEYFFHYWELIFDSPGLIFDQNYLRSHRTTIAKVKLQIDGNFSHAKKNIDLFFLKDANFFNNNQVIKKIKGTKARKSIYILKRLSNVSNNQWLSNTPKKFYKQIKIFQDWLDKDYSSLISELLIQVLEKKTILNESDQSVIKQLTNYFIIELFWKGFDHKYIRGLPGAISSIDKFPFKKIHSDFSSDTEYRNYKESEWKRLSLKNQVEAIVRLLERAGKTRYLIFHVYDINWRLQPFKLFNVEFYNPNEGFNPKIRHRLSHKIFEETFTFKPASFEESSRCNASVKIEAIYDDQFYSKGYSKVKLALSALNRELNLNGKVYLKNAFITNPKFDQIWGASSALTRDLKAIDKITEAQKQRLNYIKKLDPEEENDKAVLSLITGVSDVLIDGEYNPEKFWMTLEATFGGEKQIKMLSKAIFKIYLEQTFLFHWKNVLAKTLNPKHSFAHPEFEYEFTLMDAEKLGLTEKYSRYDFKKFKAGILILTANSELPIISEIAQLIQSFNDNKIDFYKNVDAYLEYVLSELYAQRNLAVHSNLNDDIFLLKQQEVKEMMNIVIEVFIFWYLKIQHNRTVTKAARNIISKASKI